MMSIDKIPFINYLLGAMEKLMTRKSLLFTSALLEVILVTFCTATLGATPTSEEEAMRSILTGRYPITLSGDGQWVFYLDANNTLNRKRVGDEKAVESIYSVGPAQTLSASRSGNIVGFATNNGCVGIATFASGGSSSRKDKLGDTPSVVWLDKNLYSSSPESCPSEEPNEANGPLYGALAAAISGDGKMMAIGGDRIRIVDIASRRVIQEISTGETDVLHMQFVDMDHKLFVVQALMGEHDESESTGSDMQFAVWDLQKMELFSFHNTKTSGAITNYDLQWSFSELTGELWVINTNGSYWEENSAHPDNPKPSLIRPYTANLKRCAMDKKSKLALPGNGGDGWLSFTADPLSRYVAGVTPTFNNKLKRATSTLWVLDSRTGKTLSEWHLNDELRSLSASNDGKVLFGITAGQPKSKELSSAREEWSFNGGGKLMRFDLSSLIASQPLAKSSAWSEQKCSIEGEEPHVRDIVNNTKKIPRLFEIQLSDDDRRDQCSSNDIALESQGSPRSWRQLNDGTLLIDRWSNLDQIDPENGHVLQHIPTPRSPTVCSVPLYERRQFLSWQGDTITLRPFSETLAAADRKVLVTKPGWLAISVDLLGDHFGVRWLDSRYKKDEDNEDKAEHDKGSAVAIAYDMSGKKLGQTLGKALNGYPLFDIEDSEGSTSVFSEFSSTPGQQGTYRWERSYAGSIRAYQRDAVSNTEKTVLWSDLQIEQLTGNRNANHNLPYSESDWVFDLGGSLGAHIDANSIKVYDAANRHRLAFIQVQNVQSIAWNPVNHVLVVETLKLVTDQPAIWKLTGYRIE